MGYRDPSYDELDDVGAQFEWDADNQRWLFRRDGHRAPLAVTDDEKERIETIQKRGRIVVAVAFLAAYFAIGAWFETTYTSPADEMRDVPFLISVVLLLVSFGPGYTLVDWIATRRLRGRATVGPARSRWQLWQMRVEQQSWLSLAWPWPVVVVIVWTHWPAAGLGDWIWLAIAGLLAAVLAFNAYLKAQTNSL